MNEHVFDNLEEEVSVSFLEWVITTVPKILFTILLFFIVIKMINFMVLRFQGYMTNRSEKNGDLEGRKRVVTLSELLKSTLNIMAYVAFILIILSQFGINIGPLLAGVSIFGLAISFGSQELVRDVISGFFMIFENQLRVGDIVSINGTAGLVERIEIRTIVLRDFAGEMHVFQNGKINSLTNKTKDWSAVVLDIMVAYEENPDDVIKVIEETGAELQKNPVFGPNIIEPIEVVGVDKFGESGMVIKSRIKTIPAMHNKIGREFRKLLKYAFDKHHIKIPYPQRTVYFRNEITKD